MSSNNTIENSNNTDGSNDRIRDVNSNRERNYDGLEQQCDTAMYELMMLRRQHEEIMRRYDQTRKELEYYRSRNQIMINRIEQAEQESSSLSAKLVAEKPILNRSEQDISEVDTASGDLLNDHFIPHDSRLNNYEAFRKGYEDLNVTHSVTVEKMNIMKDEINQLKKQCNELFKERNIAFREKDGIKQQYTAAIRQWNLTLQERNHLQEVIQKVQQQNEEAVIEMKSAVTYSVKSSKELKDLNKAHDAVVKEYRLIMSERDTVHKELEKLSEDLSQAYKKNKSLENEIKSCRDEKKTLQLHVESLKREILSALHDRDKALKECNDYQERFGEITAKNESQREFKSHLSYDFSRERERKYRNDSRGQDASIDLFNSCQKKRIDNLDQANQEIENLRKLADNFHNKLNESIEEAEISKRRRDWAFSERDKIVLERESIRTLCDSLRKQRDDALSKLALAIRDCDDIMKQKNDISKELNYFKQKMEGPLKKEVCLFQLQATGRYNQDSAIYTNLQERDTEILNIDLGVLGTNEDLGIDILGGRDNPLYPSDNGIYITSVNRRSVAARKLRVNDCILRVNSLDCTSVSKRLVLETMRSLSSTTLVVRRRKPAFSSRSLFTTQVNNYDRGISLETGVYINKITPGSMAAKYGNLDVGDRVLSINNTTVDNIKHSREAMLLLYKFGDVLTITTMKLTYCAGNCGSGPNRDIYKKYTNSATQTNTSSYSIYQKSYKKLQYIQSRRVIVDIPKKPQRNPLPVNTSISEQDQEDAIAELDSVIDTFRPNPAPPNTTKYPCRHRKSKELDKIGGTWPIARSGPVIEHGTGTVLHPRKNKERLPLCVLLNDPLSCSLQNNLKTVTSSIDFSVKSGKVGKDVMDYYVKKKTSNHENSTKNYAEDKSLATRPTSQNIDVPPSTNAHHFLLPQYSIYSQPAPSFSGESMLYSYKSPYSHVSQFHHSHSSSVDMHYNRQTTRSPHHIMTHIGSNSEVMPESHHGYEVNTYPQTTENLGLRIPSNTLVTYKSSDGAVGISSRSINRSVNSERNSSMLTFRIEVLNPGQITMPANERQSLPEYDWASKYFNKPLLRGSLTGELRRISIEKSVEPLGIKILCVDSSGVFVSSVTNEHCVAYKVGIQVGDQLLEVCGINLRSATYELATNVLKQCGNSVTILVQYNPDKYHELKAVNISTSSYLKTPTPCNSPSQL
ncbi:hypothetical protein QTP88_001897 [Uroleucon formosanum]